MAFRLVETGPQTELVEASRSSNLAIASWLAELLGAFRAPTRGGADHLNLVFLHDKHSTESIFNKNGRLNAARDLHLAV
jgi:hypothetical protein